MYKICQLCIFCQFKTGTLNIKCFQFIMFHNSVCWIVSVSFSAAKLHPRSAIFLRGSFSIYFSVFSIHSILVSLNCSPFFQKQLQRYEIIPHLHKNIISNFLIFPIFPLQTSLFSHFSLLKLPYFPHQQTVRWFFIYFSVFSILSVLVSLNLSSHSFAFIASLLFHLALSPPNVHPYQAPHGG